MILTLARRSVLAHKRRLVGLCAAISLGVAFLTGTLVLGDTMRASFDQVFSDVTRGVDVVIQGTSDIEAETGTVALPVYVPENLAADVESVDGVSHVQPMAEGLAQIVTEDGPVGGEGPPTLGGNWIDDEELNPQRIVAGRAPERTGEVVIDSGSARTGPIAIDDTLTVLTPGPSTVRVVGLTKTGDADSVGGTTYVGFTMEQAQELLVPPGMLSSIVAQADDDVSPDELADRIRPLAPANTEVLTGEELTDQLNEQIQANFLSFFQTFLTVFAVIALVVSTFSIYNTFSVIAAQKGRESALLRAVGATRRQILGSIAVESLLIGLFASVLGAGLGIAVAWGLNTVFAALGVGLEDSGLAVSAGSLITGFVAGIIVTVVAALWPAVRASRVPPLAALRDVAVEAPADLRRRTVLGAGLLVIGLGILASLLFVEGSELVRVGVGSAATFTGFLIFGPVAAPRVSRTVGAPIARFRGVSGRMALANATRNPRRTASTAAALMVGVAVVSMFTIFASSMKNAISESFVGDLDAELSITSTAFTSAGFDPEMLVAIRAEPGVAAVSTFDNTTLTVDGQATLFTVVDVPGISSVTDLGEDLQLRRGAIAVDSQTATDQGLAAGDRVELGFPDGSTQPVRISSTYEGTNLVTGFIAPRAVLAANNAAPPILTVFVALDEGVSEEAGQAAVQQIADEYNAGKVQTRAEFADEAAGQIDQLLSIIYALLVLAIIIALMGIANTLSLSVFERTRELGLLRAVGQTRPQLRGMVRWESVIIALFGTVGGIGLGLVLGWALFAAVATAAGFAPTLSVAWVGLIAVAAIGATVGVLAGLRPAARAAKLDVLTAIATE